MKKIIFSMFLMTFLVIALADQSWAMGKRGSRGGQFGQHHHGGSNSGSYSSHYNDDDNENYNGPSSDNEENEEGPSQRFSFLTEDLDTEENTTENNTNEEGFPASATVPEPATLALMGMGLTGLLLRRKKQ